MKRASRFGMIGFDRHGFLLTAIVLLLPASSLVGQAPTPPKDEPAVTIPDGATVASLYKDFLHYARIGRFRLARSYADALFAHPELAPERVLEIADQDRESLDTLLVMVKHASIRDSAARVLALIQQGEEDRRRSPDRIRRNIELLGGNPQQEFFAIRQLVESGEYAIPHLVDALLDPARSDLRPRILNALPRIGKGAVNPLVMALAVRNNDIRVDLINALGEVGYAQAVPYLRKLMVTDSLPEQTRDAAAGAINRIEQIRGRSVSGSPDALFFQLADQYYNEADAVRADPRLPDANVWYWDPAQQTLRRVVVPQRIFGPVMAMRCCEEALNLRNDHAESIALWLAANIRREARLGYDIENGDPDDLGETDATRPDVFPRALYFTQTAGARYAHRVLRRAVHDRDSMVALGAIEALRLTAGESSLVGTEDLKQPLVEALQFPDLLVRLRAALALGAALPKSQFAGSQLVVPILASGLAQTGREQMVVVAADEADVNRVIGDLRSADRRVVGHTNFFEALTLARKELPAVSGIVASTGITEPSLTEAWKRLRGEFISTKTPLVILVEDGGEGLAAELAENDRYVETLPAGASADELEEAFERVRERTDQAVFDPDLAQAVALQSTETLRRIAADGKTVFDVQKAEPALIGALSSSEEPLRVAAASVLALLPTPTAQRSLAFVALDDVNSDSLRLAVFGSLAESARQFGNLLEADQVTALVDVAREETDLVMRTAASQALGAINLKTSQASEIIRGYHGG